VNSYKPIYNPEVHDPILRQLWPTSMSLAEIGERLGISASYVSQKAAKLNLPCRTGRPRRGSTLPSLVPEGPKAEPIHYSGTVLSQPNMRYLREASRVRGIKPHQLVTLLVSQALQDRMIDAILDDGTTTPKASGREEILS
jgi:hypothetical protein